MDPGVIQRTKDYEFFVGSHIFEISAFPPATRSQFFAPVPVFWNDTEGLRLFCVLSPLCLAQCNSLWFGDNDRNTQHVQTNGDNVVCGLEVACVSQNFSSRDYNFI